MDLRRIDPRADPPARGLSRRAALHRLGGLATFLALAHPLRSVAAQDATPTPAYAPGVHPEILGRKEALAAPGYALQLTRITFDPGSSVAPHTHPGDTVAYQLSGSHVFTVLHGEAHLVRAGTATPTPAPGQVVGEPMTLDQEYTIEPGDVFLFDAHTAHTARNPTGQPAVVLEAQLRAVDQPLTIPLATPTP